MLIAKPAVLESCGYGLRHFLELSEQLSGKRIERFLSIGGGAKTISLGKRILRTETAALAFLAFLTYRFEL